MIGGERRISDEGILRHGTEEEKSLCLDEGVVLRGGIWGKSPKSDSAAVISLMDALH